MVGKTRVVQWKTNSSLNTNSYLDQLELLNIYNYPPCQGSLHQKIVLEKSKSNLVKTKIVLLPPSPTSWGNKHNMLEKVLKCPFNGYFCKRLSSGVSVSHLLQEKRFVKKHTKSVFMLSTSITPFLITTAFFQCIA